jgi:hypothetical protein
VPALDFLIAEPVPGGRQRGPAEPIVLISLQQIRIGPRLARAWEEKARDLELFYAVDCTRLRRLALSPS